MCLLSSSCASPGPLLQDRGSKAFSVLPHTSPVQSWRDTVAQRPSSPQLRILPDGTSASGVRAGRGAGTHQRGGLSPMQPGEQRATSAENAHNSLRAVPPPQQQILSGGTQGHPGVAGTEATGPLRLQLCHPPRGSFGATLAGGASRTQAPLRVLVPGRRVSS